MEKARQYLAALNMAVCGELGKGWSHTITESLNKNTVAGCSWRWLSRIAVEPLLCEGLQTIQIENLDWRVSVRKYDTPETLRYLDPPSLRSTRKSGGYRHELSDQDHEELAETILDLQGMTLLSGYKSTIYERLERHGWLRKDFETPCHAASPNTSPVQGQKEAKPTRIESVWLSPSLQGYAALTAIRFMEGWEQQATRSALEDIEAGKVPVIFCESSREESLFQI